MIPLLPSFVLRHFSPWTCRNNYEVVIVLGCAAARATFHNFHLVKVGKSQCSVQESRRFQQCRCRVVIPKNMSLGIPSKIAGSKTTWNLQIYIFLRIVDTESLFAHIRFIEILWIRQGSWFYGETMMRYDELSSILTKLWFSIPT